MSDDKAHLRDLNDKKGIECSAIYWQERAKNTFSDQARSKSAGQR
jgi:hypothetical protein